MPTSQHSQWSPLLDALLEAGWLVAVVVVAVFFNPNSSRTFEPDRFQLLHALAVLMLVVWLVRAIDGRIWRTWSLRVWLRRPLVAPALAFACVTVLSTATGLLPSYSFWGSYQRLNGTQSILACLVIFFIALDGLRAEARRRRLATALIVSSIAVAAYAIVQALGWDPMGWRTGFGARVASTQGNPIFAGAFLLMVAPLTLARALEGLAKEPRRAIGAGLYGLLFVLQVAALALTGSQGPAVGLGAGLGMFALLVGAASGRRRIVAGLVGLAAAGALVLALLGMPGSPLPVLRQIPGASQLSLETGTGAERRLTWRGVMAMVTADPGRALVGYGPDSMLISFARFVPPELPPLSHQSDIGYDRAHNVILDVWATLGLAGVVAYLAVVGAVFVYGLRLLGLGAGRLSTARPGREMARSAAFLAAGAIAGGIGGWLATPGHEFVGVAITAGLLAGMCAYLVPVTRAVSGPQRDLPTILSVAAVLAAIAGHLVELQAGIGVAATQLGFWLLAANIGAAQCGAEHGAPAASPAARAQTASKGGGARQGRSAGRGPRVQTAPGAGAPGPSDRAVPAELLLLSLVLATLAFAMLAPQNVRQSVGLGLGSLLLATWGLGCLAIAAAPGRDPRAVLDAFSVDIPLALSWVLPVFVLDLAALALNLAGEFLTIAFMAYLAATLGLVGRALARAQASTPAISPARAVESAGPGRLAAYAVLALAGLALITQVDVRSLRADIALKDGLEQAGSGRGAEAIASLERAVSLAPHQEVYTIYLAGAYAERARAAAAERDSWLARAERVLEEGRAVDPYNADLPARLGLLHRVWADLAAGPGAAAEHYARSAAYYGQAAELSPQSSQIQREWGAVELAMGHVAPAVKHLERAVRLGPRALDGHLLLGNARLEAGDVDGAAAAFRQAVKLDRDAAAQAQEAAVQRAPESWAAHRNLALMYSVLGRRDEALAEVRIALDRASAGERAELERLKSLIENAS